jgi:hypothetical protein
MIFRRIKAHMAKADMTLASWNAMTAIQSDIYSAPDGADLMYRGMYEATPLTDTEKLRFGLSISNLLSGVASVDVLWRQGLMGETAYQRSLKSIGFYFQSPRVRKWWKLARKDRFIPPVQRCHRRGIPKNRRCPNGHQVRTRKGNQQMILRRVNVQSKPIADHLAVTTGEYHGTQSI